jgi:oligopeptide transport system substrate-binding protein
MARINVSQFRFVIVLVVLSLILAGCTSSASSRYWGKTKAPSDNVLRYISGSEPESLDPAFGTGQPEARIYMALYDGLLEYHPKTMEPIPSIAESYEINKDATEYLFHLRHNAKFSNGDPITAKDFVYTFRRALSPELASRNANLGYYIKYAEAYNSGNNFVKDSNGQFLLKKDFVKEGEAIPVETTHETQGTTTEFHQFIDSPERLTVKADEKDRAKQLDADPKLKAAVAGKELVPVKAEDLGVEAVDDYTFRVKLYQPAPYFVQLIPHQLFRVVHQASIEKFGKEWQRVQNIVTSGAFKLSVHRPYDTLIVVKDPNNWDAESVKLDAIEFYPLEESTTMMNLYKAGSVDALYNHVVLVSWLDTVKQYKDEYMNFPENATAYYSMNMTKPPFDNFKIRQAFNLAIDKSLLSEFRKVTKPLYDLTPSGIFPEYDKAREKISEEMRQKQGVSPEEWGKRNKFDPARARKLLTEAGFPVQQNGNTFSCPTFPINKVSLTYNTNETNRQIAEFAQSQWKQNLGITVTLKNMEFKTFLPYRDSLQYDGMAQSLWSGDYMDPFTFLGLHYSSPNQGAAGFADIRYDQMLNDANKEIDPQKRYEDLARAESFIMEQLPVIPLTTNATNWIKKPYVKGMYPNPGTLHAWKFVYIETDQNKWDTNVENIIKEDDPNVEAQINQLMALQKQMQKP